jgi:ribulose-phosphate 3-epimerase
LARIKNKEKCAAVSVKPKTPIEAVYPYLDRCDMVLIMTVEPGFGGQSFMPEMLEKVRALRAEITRRGLNVDIQVDGGINNLTAKICTSLGANSLVAGSYIYGSKDYAKAINALK